MTVSVHCSTGSFARIDGAEIYHEVHGSGPALAIIPAGASRAMWWQQVPVFAGSHTVVILDPRGYGRSTDTVDHPGPLAWAQDLAGLLDQLGIERAAVLGHSMSGRAAFAFASRYPERTSAVILVGSTGGVDAAGFSDADRERRLMDDSARRVPSPVAPGFADRCPGLAYLHAQLAGAQAPGHPSYLAASLRIKPDPAPVLEHEVPVLLVVGGQDEPYPPAAVRGLRDVLPAAVLVELDAAGHSPQFECAERFNDEVLAFLEAHGA